MSARKRIREELASNAVLVERQDLLAQDAAHKRIVKKLKKVGDGPEREMLMNRYTSSNHRVEPVEPIQERNLDECPKCRVEFRRDHLTSMLKCKECFMVIQCLHFMSRDHDNQLPRPASKAMPTKPKPERQGRATLYRTYLMQFHEDTPDPPREVMSTLMCDHMRHHIYGSDTLCKKRIVEALRGKSATGINYTDYTYMTTRIMFMMRGEKVPTMSRDLIDRLVDRYEKLMAIYFEINKGRKPKTPAHAACTKFALLMEQEYELAKCMRYSKGRDTMLKSELTIRDLCARAQQRHPHQNWMVPRMV